MYKTLNENQSVSYDYVMDIFAAGKIVKKVSDMYDTLMTNEIDDLRNSFMKIAEYIGYCSGVSKGENELIEEGFS